MAKKGKHNAPFYGVTDLWRIVDVNSHYEVFHYQVIKETSLFMDLHLLSMERSDSMMTVQNDRVVTVNKEHVRGYFPTRRQAIINFLKSKHRSIEHMKLSLQELQKDIEWADRLLEKPEQEGAVENGS
jgi:hypothetical protein